MSLPGYQDITAAAMGGEGSKLGPTYMQNVIQTSNQIMSNKASRDRLREANRRSNVDINIGEKDAYRALPGQFNQRGMIDSGLYQRGGRRLAENIERIRGRSDLDFQDALQGLDLSDTAALSNLEQYRSMLTSSQYQALVAAIVGNAGGRA